MEGNQTARDPTVSVYMSVYNGGRFLVEAVRSILNQTLRELELIIIDDGSVDGSSNVLDEARDDPRVTVVHQERSGIPKSLNRALARCRAKLVARQDADDISLPWRLERQVEFLGKHPDVVGLGSYGEMIDEHGSFITGMTFPTDHQEIVARVHSEACFLSGSLMIRRNALQTIGAFRSGFPVCEDYDLFLRLLERYRVANIPEILYHYRGSNKGATGRQPTLIQYYCEVAREFAEQRREEGEDMLLDWERDVLAQPA